MRPRRNVLPQECGVPIWIRNADFSRQRAIKRNRAHVLISRRTQARRLGSTFFLVALILCGLCALRLESRSGFAKCSKPNSIYRDLRQICSDQD
jgi:hypothetical protein